VGALHSYLGFVEGGVTTDAELDDGVTTELEEEGVRDVSVEEAEETRDED
jgi:hypothetical protein